MADEIKTLEIENIILRALSRNTDHVVAAQKAALEIVTLVDQRRPSAARRSYEESGGDI